jgi:excisionase family DNA binding protein
MDRQNRQPFVKILVKWLIMAKDNYYRVGQAAHELGISSYTVRRLAESGLIPDAEYSGSRWRIPVSAVEQFKRDGVPELPRTIDSDNATTSSKSKDRPPATLLADPSPELVAVAEKAEMSGREVTAAENNLKLKRIRRDEVELEDFHREREKRLQREEEEQLRRDAELFEAEQRDHEKAEVITQRKEFISHWLEYALQQVPQGAPREIEIDVHEEAITALGKLDAGEREYTVKRLMDAAVQRALKGWNIDKNRRAAVEAAIARLPYEMRMYEPWKGRSAKAASAALADVHTGTQAEMESLALDALEPLKTQFNHGERTAKALRGIVIAGASEDEIADARDAVQEALSALPSNSSDRQIQAARDTAVQPIADRVSARLAQEQRQRQRQNVMYSVSYKLPWGISEQDKKDAIGEIEDALDDLGASASERDMETARDGIIAKYKVEYDAKAKKQERKNRKDQLVAYGMQEIFWCAVNILKEHKDEYEQGESAHDIKQRVAEDVEEELREELDGRETEQQVKDMVMEIMLESEGLD